MVFLVRAGGGGVRASVAGGIRQPPALLVGWVVAGTYMVLRGRSSDTVFTDPNIRRASSVARYLGVHSVALVLAAMQPDNATIARLVADLASRGDELVDTRYLERWHSVRFEVRQGAGGNDDPLFSRRLDAATRTSVSRWILAMDLMCTSLVGLERFQTMSAAVDTMVTIREAAGRQLGDLFCSRQASPADVTAVARALQARFEGHAIKQQRVIIERQLAGLQALSEFASAISSGDDGLSTFQMHVEAIRFVALRPPEALLSQLLARGLGSFDAVASIFAPTADTVRGASSLAPSLLQAAAILKTYVSIRFVRERFATACGEATKQLAVLLMLEDDAPEWSGLDVTSHPPSCASLDTAHRIAPPVHVGGPGELYLVSRRASPDGLRAVRFLRALVGAAPSLLPRHARASFLLASACRSLSEQRDDSDETGPTCSPPEEGGARAGGLIVKMSPPPPLTSACNISPCVERDYTVVRAIAAQLPRGGGRLEHSAVATNLRDVDAYFKERPLASAQQAVAYTMKKLMGLCESKAHRSASSRSAGAHTRFDADAAAEFASCVSATLRRMETEGGAFAAEWHPNRSSRSRAKRSRSKATGRPMRSG